jgi:cobalt-precorrin 5A hydrolase
MKVAGLGFRAAADIDALRDALVAAGGSAGLDALATIMDKAEAAAIVALGRELGLPVKAISNDALADITTATRSDRIDAMFGVGSLAEAVALAAAGSGARLVSPRAISSNGMATAAIAEGVNR